MADYPPEWPGFELKGSYSYYEGTGVQCWPSGGRIEAHDVHHNWQCGVYSWQFLKPLTPAAEEMLKIAKEFAIDELKP